VFELLLTGFILLAVAFAVYVAYFFLVIKNRRSIERFHSTLSTLQNSSSDPKPVTVIINTFNEAKVIDRKLTNTSQLNYPLDKLEILVIDDASVDGTADIAVNKIRELNLSGRVIRNPARIGLNRSLNIAMSAAKNNYVCITDSDVILEKDALIKAVSVLKGFKNAGGVTGKILPVYNGAGVAQSTESSYRTFYSSSMLGETAYHSAFPGNGPLIVFDKSLVPTTIPVDYGSTDGNIAMNVIKSGHRFVYVENAVVFEPVPEKLAQQRLQKVRRAKRLIQVVLHNKSVFLNGKYGEFGRVIFPLKFLMLILCPLLMTIGFGLFALGVAFSAN